MTSTDHIRYDVLAQEAMRGVLRRVMTDAARQGLPGDHHFYITFLTQAAGVKLSPRLMEQYPQEMTIILQHQFWDLTVTEERFEVGLSFGGVPERLVVPFNAIKSFLDPSVQFGLQFNIGEAEAPARDKTSAALAPAPAAELQAADSKSDAETGEETKPTEGAEVVRLDRFRKK
jgi:uncharacterized protein